jgi:hypothetical protein
MTKRRYVTRARIEQLRSRLSSRDHQLLKTVARLNVVSGSQLRRLYYADSPSGQRLARLDLARLSDWRVLARLSQRIGGIRAGSEGYVYALDVAGKRLLESRPARRHWEPWTPRPNHLRHALAVSDLYLQLRLATPTAARLSVFDAEPGCWRRFCGPGGARLTLKPDAYAVIESDHYEDRYFIELDRATEAAPRITEKARAYVRYWQSGREQGTHDVFPLVLWIAPHRQRVRQINDALDRLPAEHRHLFAVTTAEMAAQQLISGTFADLTTKEVT